MHSFLRYTLSLGLVGLCLSGSAQTMPKDTGIVAPHSNASSSVYQPSISNLLPSITPKSPTAAGLGRYGEYPVNLYSGLPTIEIPIYEIKIGTLSIPIKLTYHAAGHKVNDMASWVGLGWSLQTGGVVSRQVQGLADEQSNGVLGQAIKDPYAFYSASCLTYDVETRYGKLADGLLDGQRDLFSYQLPSARNTFMLTPEGPIQLSPNQVKIKPNPTLTQFELTDEQGTLFRFNAGETVGGAGYGYISSWFPTEIISAISNERAAYTYSAYPITQYNPDIIDTKLVYSELNDPANVSGVTPGIQNGISITRGSAVTWQLPTEINFPGGRLKFIVDSQDRLDGGKSLDRIELWSYNVSTTQFDLIRSYDLNYTYKNRTDNNPVLFLSEILLKDAVGIKVGSYSLTYNSTALPGASSANTDYWGYANGANNTTRVPDQPVTYQNVAGGGTTTQPINGGVRYPDEAAMKAWILTRLTYPTGGYTEFDFQTNRYSESGNSKLAGGLRISQIRNYTAANALATTKTYRYGTSENGFGTFRSIINPTFSTRQQINYYTPEPNASFSYYITTYSSAPAYPLSPNEGSPVTYATVTEYEDNGSGNQGKTVYQFNDGLADIVERHPLSGAFFLKSYQWSRGQLASKQIYNSSGQLSYKEEHEFLTLTSGISSSAVGLLVGRSVRQIGASVYGSSCYTISNEYNPTIIYFLPFGLVKEKRNIQYTYADENSGKFTLKAIETDYDPTFYLPRETRLKAEGNIIVGSQLTYPQNFSPISLTTTVSSPELQGIRALQQRNAYLPIETVNYRKESGSTTADYKTGKLITYTPSILNGLPMALPYQTYLLESTSTTFSSPNAPYQSSAQRFNDTGNLSSFPTDPRFIRRLTMTDYDSNGNLTGYTITNGSSTTFGYNTYTPLSGVVFSVVSQKTINAGQPSAQTSRYTYTRPLLGPASTADPRGVNTYFSYDSFGRLNTLKDKDGNVIKQHTYHYSTAP